MKLKTKNKSKTKLCCDCFLRSNVLFLAFTRVHSLIHAHNQIKPNQTKFIYRLRKRPVLFNVCFLMKNVFHDGFFYYFLFFCFANFVCVFSSCLFSFFPVRFVDRSRVFTKIHTKNYCSTVCVVLHFCVFF